MLWIFFSATDVLDARKLFLQKAFPREVPPRRVGNNAQQNSIADIIAAFERCDSEDIDVPDFVIRNASEIPIIPASAYSMLSSKVNACFNELRALSEKLQTQPPFPPAAPPLVEDKPTYAVIVKNVPTDLSDPGLRKDKLNTLEGHEGILSLKPDNQNKKWIVVTRDRQSAVSLAASASKSLPNVQTKVLDKKALGIVRGIPENVSESSLKESIPGLVRAIKIGHSKCFRLEFLDQLALKNAINHGLRLGYELFRVEIYQELPRRCFRCQGVDHTIARCPRSPDLPKCSRCAGAHENTTDNPCSVAPKCANCGGNHVSYSLKCSVLRNALAKTT